MNVNAKPNPEPPVADTSSRCAAILAAPLDQKTCLSFREVRRRNMCRAWDLMDTERVPFREAIRRAWAETLEGCRQVGVYSPEPAQVEKAAEMVDEHNRTVGHIALMSDGRVEVCHEAMGCEVTERASPEVYYGIRPLE